MEAKQATIEPAKFCCSEIDFIYRTYFVDVWYVFDRCLAITCLAHDTKFISFILSNNNVEESGVCRYLGYIRYRYLRFSQLSQHFGGQVTRLALQYMYFSNLYITCIWGNAYNT